MKKFFCAVFPLFYFLISCYISMPPTRVRADAATYACVLQTDTYFYTAETDTSGLFILPKTYYVKVLLASYPYTKVEYQTDGANSQKLTGYCKTDRLTFVDYTPITPYLHHIFEVTYTAENADDKEDFFHKITVSCTYYGDYYVGSKRYAYVLQNGQFGYVPLPQDFSYVESTEHAARTGNAEELPTEEAETVNAAQIAILVVLCLLVPILAAIVLRSSKKQPYDFDDA